MTETSNFQNGTCSVCLESLEDNTYTIPECNHQFHQNCIIEWYRTVGSDCGCPMCRSSPGDNSSYSRKGRIQLYKKISRRKTCPQIIKNLCARHTQCNKDRLTLTRDASQFKNNHKQIFGEYRKLRNKVFKNNTKRWKTEKELDSLPLLMLIRQLAL